MDVIPLLLRPFIVVRISPTRMSLTASNEPMGRQVYDSNNTNFKRPGFVGNAIRDIYNDVKKSYRDAVIGKWGLILTPVKVTLHNPSVVDEVLIVFCIFTQVHHVARTKN